MLLFGIEYTNVTFNEALSKSLSLLHKDGKSNVFFLNADYLYKALNDKDYHHILCTKATLLFPDGIGLRLITQIMNGSMKDNCNGSDLTPAFLDQLRKTGEKIFLLGGAAGVADRAGKRFMTVYQGLKVVGTHDGYFNDDKKVIKEINNSSAEILLVGMGAPMQEKWIVANRDMLNPKICFAVGALLNYWGGVTTRGPRILRTFHLEWLWRLCLDPKRLIKRYIVDGAKLFVYVFKARFSSRN